MTEELLYDKHGDVAWVTFNRPQARNALTFAMYQGLADVCERIGKTREAKVIVVTGAGDKAFAAGTDIAQFRDFKSGEDGIAYERKMDATLEIIERCPVPTIAAVAGFCTGGGMAIAGACDFRLASANAQFGVPIARTLGNCLSMGNYARLASLVGPQTVKEMLLLARMIDAPRALQAGLVMEVVPDATALLARAQEVAETMAGHAPVTLSTTKEAMRRLQTRIADENIDDLIRNTYGSADFREGMSAFLEKRAPKWTGR
jgi:enoyl-CoA hydratase/carnithine racemase